MFYAAWKLRIDGPPQWRIVDPIVSMGHLAVPAVDRYSRPPVHAIEHPAIRTRHAR
jgi:hypothetical protein